MQSAVESFLSLDDTGCRADVRTRTETSSMRRQLSFARKKVSPSRDVTPVKCPIRYNAIIFAIPHLFGMRALHTACVTRCERYLKWLLKLLLPRPEYHVVLQSNPLISNAEAAIGDIKVALA